MAEQTPALPHKLQPTEKLDLPENTEQHSDFIVSGTGQGLSLAQALEGAVQLQPHPLPIISSIGLSLTMSEAIRLARRDDVSQVWFVGHGLYPAYVRILEGLEYARRTDSPPAVLNMSLGPPADEMPMLGHEEEPMNAATKRLADSGFIIVIAVGSYYSGYNEGMVNPWCEPAWVNCGGSSFARCQECLVEFGSWFFIRSKDMAGCRS